MQDRLVIGLPRSASTRIRVGKRMVLLSELHERVVIASPVNGSNMVIATVNDRIVVRCNPVGFLTGQNLVGSSNVYALTHRVLEEVDQQQVDWGRDVRRAIRHDDVNVHELAFAKYLALGEDMQSFTDLLKSCLGSMVQHVNPRHPLSVHLYQGEGGIVRTNDVSLTFYNKYEKTRQLGTNWSPPQHLRRVAKALRQQLRLECTVKYNWFGARRRKLSFWRDADTTAIEDTLFAECLGRKFYIDYIMSCPGVFAENYTENWSATERAAYQAWLTGVVPDARTIRKLYTRHGFDAGLSALGHRNLLWTLYRPECLTVRTPRRFDPSTIRAPTAAQQLFARYAPLATLLHQGADATLLKRIDKQCGI